MICTNQPFQSEKNKFSGALLHIFTNDVPERSPEDRAPEMDPTSCAEEKANMVTHAEEKRAEDMACNARAPCGVAQVQEDCEVPETNELLQSSQSVGVESVPGETVQESVATRNEGIIKAGKHANKIIKRVEEAWIEGNTEATEAPEQLLARDVNTALSHTYRADEETVLEKIELPGTSKCYQVFSKPIPSMDLEMSSTRRRDLSSSSERESESELELESGGVQSRWFTIPVEEKGVSLFLDSCQEAFALDFEVISLNETDEVGEEQTSPAADDTKQSRMRLRGKGGQECSVS